MSATRYHLLCSDIGGVLGTNGWDSRLRRKVADHFGFDFEGMERRHLLMFDSFERGFMSFESYISRIIFDAPRDFTFEDIRDFAYAESIPWLENIALLRTVKRANGLKLGLISNEGEGLTAHRVRKWGLRDVADFLVFSHCVHLRKPDHAIWQLALDLAQADASEAVYIDDREMFASIAAELGFAAICHTSVDNTRRQLKDLGLIVDA